MNEQEKIMLLSYNVIRREVRNFQRDTDDSELGNYVRGVVDLQTEIYSCYMREMQEERVKNAERI